MRPGDRWVRIEEDLYILAKIRENIIKYQTCFSEVSEVISSNFCLLVKYTLGSIL